MKVRMAVIKTDRTLDVENYLPHNYRVIGHTEAFDKGDVIIAGTDDHGWTLHGYVLPRLGSGLLAGYEVGPDLKPL